MPRNIQRTLAQILEAQDSIATPEWGRLQEKMGQMETESGILLSGSPHFENAGDRLEHLICCQADDIMPEYEAVDTVEKLFSLIGGRSVLFHRQLEGLPLILNYENGTLERMEVYCPQNTLPKQSTVYRIRQLWNVPMTIPYRESLKVGGCVVLSGRWKSHQTTLLAQILASKVPDVASRWEQFRFLATNGFTTVDYALLAADAPMSALQAILKQYRSGVFSPPTNRFIFEYNDLVNTPGLKFCFPK